MIVGYRWRVPDMVRRACSEVAFLDGNRWWWYPDLDKPLWQDEANLLVLAGWDINREAVE